MDCNSCRFNECALLKTHVFRELVAVILRQSVVPRQCTIVRRCSSECHIRTEVVFAFFATHTATARDTRFHCDAVADLQCLDLVANFLDNTGRLMTKYHGLLNDEVTNAALDPVVDI